MKMRTLLFDSMSRADWVHKISNYVATISASDGVEHIHLAFSSQCAVALFEPTHIVTLACLIQNLSDKGYRVFLDRNNEEVWQFLWISVRLREYWKGGQNYTPAQDDTVCNLWRIVNEEKEMHSIRVHDYLQRHFFQHKDLSAVKNSLDEAYCNIFDHAEAQGNAFSFIKYDADKERLQVAVCDFGKGIARTIKNCERYSHVQTDAEALEIAIKDGETVQSQLHNRGRGLGNIITSRCWDGDVFRLISNDGLIYITGELQRSFEDNFNFPGTLMYYELSLSHFDDLDILSSFELQ